ncbi:hypothetical protein Skr01_68290 [Sphaerisporangium krabiense]|uniref:Ketosteroid isomerase-like protein n=1 Tax=Sphaerisporangium krabiense TaxID=763782 RepID=A0A7W8Z3V7_9ACTN|nr:ester cyclase [Sphaerisporangium krabiense]MBB5626944.1 ketosteroid isomerase-like protein [Sphaerisporangium krabiense]GII66744.1 hypothetical protein Skr01_68290 [Sphaerisporangium krabiense]
MTEARQVHDRYIAAFNAHDMDALLRELSPEGVTISPDCVTQGCEELASVIEEFWEAFPDVRTNVMESFDDGDTAIDELLMQGTHLGPYRTPGGRVVQATHRPISLRCFYLTTVENGLIVSLRLYFDQLQLRDQLGLPCD